MTTNKKINLNKLKTLIKETIKETYENDVFEIEQTTKNDLLPFAEKHPSLDWNMIKIDSIPPGDVIDYLILERGDWKKWKNEFKKRYGNGKIKYDKEMNTFYVFDNDKFENERTQRLERKGRYYDSLDTKIDGDIYKGD